MGKVNITIDGCQMQVEDNLTVLEAARQAGIEIPTLCYLKDLNKIGACRICLVEVQGARGLQASCSYPVSEGMVVRTNTKQVREARKATLEEETIATSKEAACWAKLKKDSVTYPQTKLTKRLNNLAELHNDSIQDGNNYIGDKIASSSFYRAQFNL